MKKYLLSFLIASAVGSLFAAPRSLSDAQMQAQQFLSQRLGHPVQLHSLGQRMLAPGMSATAELQPYYAFNDEQSQSFVVVSGSDLMRPVIGYSSAGILPESPDELPENVRSWFTWLGEATAYAERHPEAALTQQQMSRIYRPIEPLMGSQWGQDAPYNALCPTGCPTGCLATAAAQVFRYHFAKSGQIVNGIGSHSYKLNGKTLSVDYSKQTYDYTKMPLTANDISQEECDELAKLSYHVGVGLDMNYAPAGSGALTSYVPRLASQHFGFNSLTSYISRAYFSYDEWMDILQGELDQERPVLYAGVSSTGGHAFVLEGIDSNGLFYTNWGWDGRYNGYFDVTVLNPEGVGTGATASDDGFCQSQDAIVGLCFEEGAGHYYTPLQVLNGIPLKANKTSVQKGGSVTISVDALYNLSPETESGYVGLVLMQGDQEIKRVTNSSLVSAQGSRDGYLFPTSKVSRSFTFEQSLADGTYQLWMYYQPKGKDYSDYIRDIHVRQSYFTVVVDGNNVKVSREKIDIPLTVSNWIWEHEPIETRPTELTCHLTNPSDESFVATYQLTLTDPDGESHSKILANNGAVVNVGPGETKVISFAYRFTKVGKWLAEVDFIRQNLGTNPEPFYAADAEFEVVYNETQGSDFLMTKTIEQVSDTVYLNREATFRLSLQNKGVPYNGQMGIRFFKRSSGTEPESEFFSNATFGQDVTGTVDVTGLVQGLKAKTVYYARAYYLSGQDYLTFETQTGVNKQIQVRIYPEPEEGSGIDDILMDDAADLSRASVYDIMGKPVTVPADGQLPRGLYIINGKKRVIR